jgi:hypothetical protein
VFSLPMRGKVWRPNPKKIGRSLRTMKSSVLTQCLAAACLAASSVAVHAQTAIQLFSPANVRMSTQGTTSTNPDIFNSTIVNLTCTNPISAVLSSSASGTANLLVDNTITFSNSGATPVNLCGDCFNNTYESEAGTLIGQDPDTLVSSGGVPPIDISTKLTAGAVQAQFQLVDVGGFLASSSLYLVTNCTSNGVAGPGKVTGNPISQSNPTASQLTQNFAFNATTNQQVQFTYDLSEAEGAGTLSITDGATPNGTDNPLNATTFQSTFLKGTSFATGNCLIHTGELLNGAPACKLYTLTCQVGTNPAQSGALCPTSQQRN